jgi:hypothetical protein
MTLEAILYNREAKLRAQLAKNYKLTTRARLEEILLLKRKLKNVT